MKTKILNATTKWNMLKLTGCFSYMSLAYEYLNPTEILPTMYIPGTGFQGNVHNVAKMYRFYVIYFAFLVYF